jgi:hypothetical protein
MLPTTTAPILYRELLEDFFRGGGDFFVSYFHADEIADAVGGWRRRLYRYDYLVENLARLRARAAQFGFSVRFVTVRDLADILFDEHRSLDA